MAYLPELHRLEHQLELAHRAVRRIGDRETQRLEEFALEIGGRLRRLQAAAREEAIRGRAYDLWQAAGRPEGRDLDFWLRAERELRGDC
jgi:hypothetical protein